MSTEGRQKEDSSGRNELAEKNSGVDLKTQDS